MHPVIKLKNMLLGMRKTADHKNTEKYNQIFHYFFP